MTDIAVRRTQRFAMIPYDPPIPPPRPPDEDPDAEFIVLCKWGENGSLESVNVRRREVVKEQNVTYPVISEYETIQIVCGRNLVQLRNPSGVVWKFAIDLRNNTPAREMPEDSGTYKVYLTWDKTKKLQSLEFSRRLPTESNYTNPIAHKTYVIGDMFPEQRIIKREMDGCLKSLTLTVGSRVGRFGPAEPPPNAHRFRSFVMNGAVQSFLIPYSVGPIDDVVESCSYVQMPGMPDHKLIKGALKFKRRSPPTAEQLTRKCKMQTFPISNAPSSVFCDTGEFIIDDSPGPTTAPLEEQDMWPYLRRKYDDDEFFRRMLAYSEGKSGFADFNVYTFSPSALQKMRQKARKAIEDAGLKREAEPSSRNNDDDLNQIAQSSSH